MGALIGGLASERKSFVFSVANGLDLSAATNSAPRRTRRGTLRGVKRLAVLALVLAAAAGAASSAGAKTTPFGHTYQTTVKGQPAPLNGVWLIAFTPKGAYTVTKKPSSAALIAGTATVSGRTLAFHDAGGPLACRGGAKTGSYVWTLSGKKLTLKIVKDTCDGRPLILAGAPFTKVR